LETTPSNLSAKMSFPTDGAKLMKCKSSVFVNSSRWSWVLVKVSANVQWWLP